MGELVVILGQFRQSLGQITFFVGSGRSVRQLLLDEFDLGAQFRQLRRNQVIDLLRVEDARDPAAVPLHVGFKRVDRAAEIG